MRTVSRKYTDVKLCDHIGSDNYFDAGGYPTVFIDNVNTLVIMRCMDIHFELNGAHFVWNARKASGNPTKHDGITFEQAASVFFDPLFALVDAGRNKEARDAIIGYDTSGKLLFVVHIELEGEFVRIISARLATNEERVRHEHS